MVLGRDDEILHSGIGCRFRPCIRIVEIWVKVVKVGCVFRIGHFFAGLQPLVARSHRVDAPVDEHPKAVVCKPGCISRGWVRLDLVHMILT